MRILNEENVLKKIYRTSINMWVNKINRYVYSQTIVLINAEYFELESKIILSIQKIFRWVNEEVMCRKIELSTKKINNDERRY